VGARQRCSKCQGCWSCDNACAKRAWRLHKLFCTENPTLKRHVPTELAIERALTRIPKAEEVPDDAVCYVCHHRHGPDGSAVPLRGCACRGPSAGFAHVDCLVEMASRNKFVTVEGRGPISRWRHCATCHQQFTGALEIEMARRCWRYFRDTPSRVDKCHAGKSLAGVLATFGELDVVERLHDEAGRGVADDNLILSMEAERARSLVKLFRPRDALEILSRVRPRMELRANAHVRIKYNYVMSTTLAVLGRVEDALPLTADVVECARTDQYGPHSAGTLNAMDFRAVFLQKNGGFEEAKVMLRHVLAARTRLLGPNHEQTRRTVDILRRVAAL